MGNEKKYIIYESKKYKDSYVVYDVEKKQTHEFYNLASARSFVRRKEKEEKNE